jgi:8-oxo-dGTP pyrophosphatase MutT (NUDIX family)
MSVAEGRWRRLRTHLDAHGAAEVGPSAGRVGAVLALLAERGDGDLELILTRRRDDLPTHPGQVSFPGGRREPGESTTAAALREAHEEIGLPPEAVTILGALQPTPTIATNYAVYPFVGLIEAGQTWRPSASEVAAVLEFPLGRLREGFGRRRLLRRGVPFRTDVYVVDDQLIWGATARILADLLERVPTELG